VATQIERLQVERETARSLIDPADCLEFERYQARCRAQLEQQEFEATWEQGRKLELDQAIELALQEVG
jgi:hypothetical protein